MIKKLEINNFKAFEHAELELNNFTLLAGRNSVGKTSVIQAIFAMIQNGKNPFRGEYMNIGMSGYFPADGDEVRLRFTLYSGADLGVGDNGEVWGDW